MLAEPKSARPDAYPPWMAALSVCRSKVQRSSTSLDLALVMTSTIFWSAPAISQSVQCLSCLGAFLDLEAGLLMAATHLAAFDRCTSADTEAYLTSGPARYSGRL